MEKKDYYFEINKIYSENEINLKTYLEINLDKFSRSNIKNYKNIKNEFEREYLKKYFNTYIELIEKKEINYKSNKKNLQAIEYIIQLPSEICKRKNKKKLNTFIDSIKNELIEDTIYLSFIKETCGKSHYLHILTIDRYYFPNGKEIQFTKIIYKDKKTGIFCSKDQANAKQIKINKKEKIFLSDKIRIYYINTNPATEQQNKIFINFTIYIKKMVKILLKKLLKNKYNDNFHIFKKMSLKRKKKLNNGKTITINKKDYKYSLNEDYERRRVKIYNSLINTLNVQYEVIIAQGNKFLDKIIQWIKELEEIKKIDHFENEISFLKSIIINLKMN